MGETAPTEIVSSAADESLLQAERAYQAGDFRRMRELCAKLSAGSDRELASRAQALMARVAVDPLALVMLMASLLLLGVILHAYVL